MSVTGSVEKDGCLGRRSDQAVFLLTKRKPRLVGAFVTIRVLANERATGGNARRRGWGKGVDIEHATGIRQPIGTWTRRILRSGRDQASTETKGRHLGEGLDGTRGELLCAFTRGWGMGSEIERELARSNTQCPGSVPALGCVSHCLNAAIPTRLGFRLSGVLFGLPFRRIPHWTPRQHGTGASSVNTLIPSELEVALRPEHSPRSSAHFKIPTRKFSSLLSHANHLSYHLIGFSPPHTLDASLFSRVPLTLF